METKPALIVQLEPLMRPVLADPETVILGLVFLAVFSAVLGLAGLMARDPIRRRLAGDLLPRPPSRADGSLSIRTPLDREARWEELLRPVESYFMRGANGSVSNLRLRLRRAGFTHPSAARIYVLLRALLAAGASSAFLVVAAALDWQMPLRESVPIGIGLGVLGLVLPSLGLSRRIERRSRNIADGFPDALDMMVVCVEAGVGLDAALTRVGAQIAPAHPVLSAELGLVALELRAGKSREDALHNFAKRVGLRQIGAFVTLLIQSDALGTSIAQSLRVHADEMRHARMLRAEEMAHKLPVKLTLPLVTCILPAMLATVLLPGIIGIVRHVLPHLGN